MSVFQSRQRRTENIRGYLDVLLIAASGQVKVEHFFEAMSVHSIRDLGQGNKLLVMRVALKDVKTYTIDGRSVLKN